VNTQRERGAAILKRNERMEMWNFIGFAIHSIAWVALAYIVISWVFKNDE
jgi:hypothetical protein